MKSTVDVRVNEARALEWYANSGKHPLWLAIRFPWLCVVNQPSLCTTFTRTHKWMCACFNWNACGAWIKRLRWNGTLTQAHSLCASFSFPWLCVVNDYYIVPRSHAHITGAFEFASGGLTVTPAYKAWMWAWRWNRLQLAIDLLIFHGFAWWTNYYIHTVHTRAHTHSWRSKWMCGFNWNACKAWMC